MLELALMGLALTPIAGPPAFEVRGTTGEPAAIELAAIEAGAIRRTTGDPIAAGEWYSLRRAPGRMPAWPAGPHIELGNGDRVRGAIVDCDGAILRARLGEGDHAPILKFPLSTLRAAWIRMPSAEPDWLTAPRRRDVIQLKNGDRSLGAIAAIDPTKNSIRFQVDGKDQTLEWSRVAAIGFNTDLARIRKPKGPYYRLTLDDGTRLSVISLACDGAMWTAETQHKDAVSLPFDRVVSVDVEQGKAVALSDLKPTKYQYESFDGEEFALATDRSALGQPLRLTLKAGESTFDRGLGLHAECSAKYPLAGKYRRFEALVGLDARSGQRGDAVLSISVDGKEQPLPNAGRLTHAAGPISIRLDVAGGRELTIAVKRGAGGIVQDHVNLVEPRLIP